ncbi:MAG TPA: hypothetical protein VIY27_09055 [Myxococcota bacterium]
MEGATTTASTPADEAAELVNEANASEPEAKPKRKRAKRASRSSRAASPPAPREQHTESDAVSSDELGYPEFDPSERPEPEENVKTLEGLCAKHNLGRDPDFYVQISRLHPKLYPGTAIKADGYLEKVSEPIGKDYIKQRYGGGKYVCMIYGPTARGGSVCYARCVVDIPGEMDTSVLTDKLRKEQHMGVVQQGVGAFGAAAPAEAPSVATKAMEILSSLNERSHSRVDALEAKILDKSKGDTDMLGIVRDLAETQTARAIGMMEKSNERERFLAEQRLEDERAQRLELTRRLDTIERGAQRSGYEDVERINSLVGKTSESQERILQHTIDRHGEELKSIRESHEQAMRSMRESFEAEKRTMRENHARDIEANDRRWESKIERAERDIERARDERTRDREHAEQRLKDREESWRIQSEQSKSLIETSWQARLHALESSYEVRVNGYEERLAQIRADLAEAKGQVASQGDPFQQIEKARALVDMGKELVGGSGGGEPKDQSLTDQIIGAVASDPAGILNALGNAIGGRGGAPPGAPPGGLVPIALAPGQGAPGGVMAPALPAASRAPAPPPSGPYDLDALLEEDEYNEEQQARAYVRQEMEQRRSPPRPEPQPRVAPPPPPQRQPARQPPAQQQPGAPLEPQYAILVAKLIDGALDRGDEPEEFAAEVLKKVPQAGVVALLQRGPQVVLQSVQQHVPTSQALSPAGVRFTVETFNHLLAYAQSSG